MPQEITIVQCFKCHQFQTKIVTISKKWRCVVCNENQSLKKTFGTGSGKDCRQKVQQLNEQWRNQAETGERNIELLFDKENENECIEHISIDLEPVDSCENSNSILKTPKISKWTKYLEDESQQ